MTRPIQIVAAALLHTLCMVYLLGCPQVYVPPSPPSYEEDVPDDPYYQNLASSTVHFDKVGDVPADPAEALAFCEAQIRELGWTLQPKGGDPELQWSRFTTTSGNIAPVILLGAAWDERSTASKARTMCHELVHCYQWDDLGDQVFVFTYVINEGTWALEVPAYAMSLHVWRLQHPDATIAEVEAQARRYATNLVDKYKLTNMPRDYAVEMAVAIMMENHHP